jgi:predicted cupin superfamily sugar epimerase
MNARTADDVIRALGLAPHPEGGFYRETFRSAQRTLATPGRPERAASTAIYFLLRAGEFSAFHRVASDEGWHHYQGASVEIHTIDERAEHARFRLGQRLPQEEPQFIVQAGVFQAARVVGSGFSLCGCTVAPGFDFADFEMPSRAELCARFPAHRSVIEELTR